MQETDISVPFNLLDKKMISAEILPFQAQFIYRHKNGGRYMRVITKSLKVTGSRKAMEEVCMFVCMRRGLYVCICKLEGNYDNKRPF